MSDKVSQAAGHTCVGVFNGEAAIRFMRGSRVKSNNKKRLLSFYFGWVMTLDEYNTLYAQTRFFNAFTVPLDSYLKKNWCVEWDEKWRGLEWVVVGRPLSVGCNFNTRGALSAQDAPYKARFIINNSSKLKKLDPVSRKVQLDGTYLSVVMRPGCTIETNEEIFVPYHARF